MTFTSVRIARGAAILSAAAWSAKAVAIGLAGGLDKSPAESPLFFAGLVALVIAAVSLGVALTRGRPSWLRIVGGVLGAVAGVAVTLIVGAITSVVEAPSPDRHWIWTELNLWAAALLVLLVSVRVARPINDTRDPRTREPQGIARA